MSKKLEKDVYTLEEIGELILKKCPNRFKNLNSAYASAKIVANRLGVEDINGKKRNKLIAARDAEKSELKAETTAIERPAEQVSLFDESVLDWLEPYTPHSNGETAAETAEDLKIPTDMPEEVDPRELFEAGIELMRAINRFAEVIGMNRR